MRTLGKTLLASTVAIGLAGACGLAFAKEAAFHTMTAQLPDGGTATIQYTGNVAPKVTIRSNPFSAGYFVPFAPFQALNQISAEMDREMTQLFGQDQLMNPNRMFEANLQNAPAGSTEYSMVSTLTPNGMCMRRTQITRTGQGKPKIVSQSSGNCGPAGAALNARPDTSFSRDTHSAPKLHEVNYQTPG